MLESGMHSCGGRTGGEWGPGTPIPGVQPPYPAQNFSPYTPPFFSLFIFSGTPAQNS